MGLFFKNKNENSYRARVISIKNPRAFNRSIRILERGGLTTPDRRALVLAQNRARAQLNRTHLKAKERRQMRVIANTKF